MRSIVCCVALLAIAAMAGAQAPPDLPKIPVFYSVPGMDAARVERDLVFLAAGDTKLEADLYAFVAAALAKNAPVSLINYPAGDHGFEILNDTDETRRVIRQSIVWLKSRLSPSS